MPEDADVTSRDPLQTARTVDIFEDIDASRSRGILQTLESVHPAYQANRKLWRMMGDVALNRIRTRSDRKRYLVQGLSEQDRLYEQRLELSAFLPETPSLLSDFLGAVFSKSARRGIRHGTENRIKERIERFIDSSGPAEQPLPRMAKEAAEIVLVFGSCDAFLDHPAPADHSDEGTEIPAMVLYTPEERLDWQEGQDGH